ncbi:MAG: hypothetical protein IKB50_00070 [Clostridia bacterium]|nr:hypothetical protein [Clostridia bacterium]
MVILLLTIILTGCGKNAEVRYTVDELLRTPYKAECTARISTNKTVNEFTYSCQRFEDGTYTVDYGDMKITVDSSGAVLSGYGMEKNTGLAEGVLPLLPTYFFENYLADGKVKETDEGYILSCDIQGDNPYRVKGEMTTDKNLIPTVMRIADKDGRTTIDVEITDFHRKAE